MILTRDQIQDMVIQCLTAIIEQKGEVPPITKTTDPIGGLGLESLDGLAFACLLSKKLNYQIPNEINPLVNDKKAKARTVGEIVDLLDNLLLSLAEGQNVRQ